MIRKMTEWPSKRGPITKIMPLDGCKGDTEGIFLRFETARAWSACCHLSLDLASCCRQECWRSLRAHDSRLGSVPVGRRIVAAIRTIPG